MYTFTVVSSSFWKLE